jgi:hypothetical protein
MFKLFSKRQRQAAIEAVKSAPEHYIVEIKPRSRSLDQNAMLWRLLTIASKSVPWTVNGVETMLTPEDWKDIFTASLHQENRIAKGIRGGFVILGRSTSKMSISQMTELIEFIYQFLAEQGVAVDLSEQETA